MGKMLLNAFCNPVDKRPNLPKLPRPALWKLKVHEIRKLKIASGPTFWKQITRKVGLKGNHTKPFQEDKQAFGISHGPGALGFAFLRPFAP